MKKRFIIILAIGFLPLSSFAQRDTLGQGGRANLDSASFNPATVVSVSGTIVNVVKTTFENKRHSGIHIMLQNEEETIEVHLGPEFYLNEQGASFNVNDEVFVKGSRIEMSGGPIIIASEITKDGKLVRLREPDGVPLWSGQGRRGNKGRMRN